MLRTRGLSILTISRQENIAKSTVSLWVRDVALAEPILRLLETNSIIGRTKGLRVLNAKRQLKKTEDENWARKSLERLNLKGNPDFWKLCAALLFWCEGTKRPLSVLCFTNSDPELIKSFLMSMRSGFPLEERKFSVVMHLHEYHDEYKQKVFWSKITGIPTSQFKKTYLKPNTGLRKRAGYQGCLSIRYGDAKIARKLYALYHAFSQNMGA